ncbi:MAG: STAS domain-containing protein, partial [Rhodoferax sp.]
WWTVRLDALRAMHLQDEFELSALDYCVTFELAPPAWEEARCEYQDLALADSGAALNEEGAPDPQRVIPTTPMGLGGMPAVEIDLKGQVLGDASQALAGAGPREQPGDLIVVHCEALVRVDFAAAGSILNWAAMRQSEGCHVQFREVHRLVAAFFNVIGINEHARVIPRPI